MISVDCVHPIGRRVFDLHAQLLVGAGAGAYAGHQVEKSQKSSTTYQVVVKMEDGRSRTFNFSSATSYRTGDRIKVVDGKLTRQ